MRASGLSGFSRTTCAMASAAQRNAVYYLVGHSRAEQASCVLCDCAARRCARRARSSQVWRCTRTGEGLLDAVQLHVGSVF